MTVQSLTRRFVLLRALRWLPFGLGLPFFVLLPEDRGLGLGTIGAFWAVHSVVTLVLEVPSGALADAVGRRRTLLAGGTLTAAGLGIFAFATAVTGFAAAAAAIATGRALISGSLEAWFVDALRGIDQEAELRGPLAAGTTAEALFMAAGALVGGFLPLLAGGLPQSGEATLLQLSIPFLAGAGAAVAYVGVVWAWVKEPGRAPLGGVRPALAAAGAMARGGLEISRRSHTVRLLLGIAASLGVVLAAVEILWQPRLEDLIGGESAGSAPLFGVLAAAGMLAVGAGAAISPRLARGRGSRGPYVGSILVIAASVALLAFTEAIVLFCVLYLLFYWALGVADPLHFEMLHDAIEGPARATVVSAESLTSQIGAAGGNLALGGLAGAQGIPAAWLVAAATVLAGALLARSVRPEAVAATPRPRQATPSGVA